MKLIRLSWRNLPVRRIRLQERWDSFIALSRRAFQKLAKAFRRLLVRLANIHSQFRDGAIIIKTDRPVILQPCHILTNRIITEWLPIHDLVEEITAGMRAMEAGASPSPPAEFIDPLYIVQPKDRSLEGRRRDVTPDQRRREGDIQFNFDPGGIRIDEKTFPGFFAFHDRV